MRRKKKSWVKKALVGGLAAAALVSGTYCAQNKKSNTPVSQPVSIEQTYSTFDLNKDGIVTDGEVLNRLTSAMRKDPSTPLYKVDLAPVEKLWAAATTSSDILVLTKDRNKTFDPSLYGINSVEDLLNFDTSNAPKAIVVNEYEPKVRAQVQKKAPRVVSVRPNTKRDVQPKARPKGNSSYKIPKLMDNAENKINSHIRDVYNLASSNGVKVKWVKRTANGQLDFEVRDTGRDARYNLSNFQNTLPSLGVQYSAGEKNKGWGRGTYFRSERLMPKRDDLDQSKRYGQKGKNVKIDRGKSGKHQVSIKGWNDDYVILAKDHGANWIKRHGDESVVLMRHSDYLKHCGDQYQLKKGGDLLNGAITAISSGNVPAGLIDIIVNEAGDTERPTAYHFNDVKSAFTAYNKLTASARKGHKHHKQQTFGLDMDQNGTPEFQFTYALSTNNRNRNQLKALDDVMYVNQNKCGVFKDALIRAALGAASRYNQSKDSPKPDKPTGGLDGNPGGTPSTPPSGGLSGSVGGTPDVAPVIPPVSAPSGGLSGIVGGTPDIVPVIPPVSAPSGGLSGSVGGSLSPYSTSSTYSP